MSDVLEQQSQQSEAPGVVSPGEEGAIRLSPLSEPPAVQPAGFPELGPDPTPAPPASRPGVLPHGVDIRLLSDIPLQVTVELGRTTLTVTDLLKLRPGSVVELTDGVATVDVVVNGRLVARGDVVVVEDSFGVRITEIVEP
jgi:flagellar motor switch protein FliN/FliY